MQRRSVKWFNVQLLCQHRFLWFLIALMDKASPVSAIRSWLERHLISISCCLMASIIQLLVCVHVGSLDWCPRLGSKYFHLWNLAADRRGRNWVCVYWYMESHSELFWRILEIVWITFHLFVVMKKTLWTMHLMLTFFPKPHIIFFELYWIGLVLKGKNI